jgi:hypothetical protein
MALTPHSASPTQAEQNELDDELDNSFPASDPPSLTDPTQGIRSSRAVPDEARIRRRAYEIWEQTGAPHGSHEAHWAQARRELTGEAGDGPPRTPTEAEEVR